MRSKLMIRVFIAGFSMIFRFLTIIALMLKEQNPKTSYHKRINNAVKSSKDYLNDVQQTLDVMPNNEASWDDIYKAAKQHKEEE